MTFLNDNERAELIAQHKLERDKKICDRIKAVLLSDKGWSYELIAEALMISPITARNHLQDYRESKKLRPEGGGSTEKLSIDQVKSLTKTLEDNIYLYVKDIAAMINSRWKVNYSISGLTNWLHRHSFSYKKPSLVPCKANLKEQKEWISKYEMLKASLNSDETIGFIDGVHPTHNVEPAYGWIRKGVRKEIPSNTGRARLNLSGMVDLRSKKVVIQEDKTLNANSTIDFFKRIESVYPDKSTIHLFCDNARYYRNKSVTGFLENSRIKLHFLPPYSPNLNPIERLWKWMKERVVYNTYYEYFEDFAHAIFGFFETINRSDPEGTLGQTYFTRITDNFTAIGN